MVAVKKLLLGAALGVISPLALATDPYSTIITVNNSTVLNQGFTTVTDLLNTFTDASFKTFDPNNLPATSTIDLRGLTGVVLNYQPAGGGSPAQLTLQIPSLTINKTFSGSNLDQSEQLLKSFLEGNGGQSLISKLSNALAASSPIDPIAGNPTSLLSSMVNANFSAGGSGAGVDAGVSGGGVSVGAGGAAQMGGQPQNFLALATHFSSYTQHDNDTEIVSLPLSFTHDFSDPRYALTFDIPIAYMKSDGAQSGSVSFGAGLRLPAAERWSLTPMLRVGAGGSEDLGAAAVIYSGGLMSDYRFLPVGGVRIGLLDMVTYYKTSSVKIGNYDSGYDLSNVVYRNGLDFSGETGWRVSGIPTTWGAQVVRTDFTGDQLFCRYSNDFSLSIGTRQRRGEVLWNALRLGVTYTYAGEDIRGFGVNMGYTF